MRCAALAGAFLLVSVAPTSALAQARDPAAAEELFRKGREAIRRGDYAAGCPMFEESQRLDPSVGTLMNVADCEEHDGALATAWGHWHDIVDAMARSGDDRIGVARSRLEGLDKRVPRLTVHLSADARGGQISRDDVAVGTASLDIPLPVDPGVHRLTVTVPLHQTATREVEIHEGDALEVTLLPGPPLPPAPAKEATTPTSAERGRGGRTTAGIVALGLAGASLVMVAVSSAVVLHEKGVVNDNCRPNGGCSSAGFDAVSTMKSWLVVNAVSWVSTAVFTGAGVALILTDHGRTTTLAPAAMRGGAGLSLGQTF